MRSLWPALLPALAQLIALLFGADGSMGAFQAGAVALVVAVLVGAFHAARRWELLLLPSAAALLSSLVHLVFAAGGSALVMGWLVFCVSACALGTVSYGRAIRVPAATAGVVATALLTVAMTGTYWADPVSQHLPQGERRAFTQAVLHVDPLLACAYGAAEHDRLHDADVYDSVPLASSLREAPAPLPTGGAWLVVGLVLAGLGMAVRRWGPRAEDDAHA